MVLNNSLSNSDYSLILSIVRVLQMCSQVQSKSVILLAVLLEGILLQKHCYLVTELVSVIDIYK